MNPKVLLGVVTSNHKDYCVEAFKKQLEGFTYDNYDIMIVDNSEDSTHVNVFSDIKCKAVHKSRFRDDGTCKRGNEMLAECQNVLREECVTGGYEFLFMLESDVFVPVNFIEYAVSFDVPVYTITYPVRLPRYDTPSMCVQYLHKLHRQGIGKVMVNTLMLPPDVIFPAEVKPITHYGIGDNMCLTHTGLGSVMLRSDVMAMLPFRVDNGNDRSTGNMTFSDTFFFTDCLAHKIEVLYDNRMIAHHEKEWYKDILEHEN